MFYSIFLSARYPGHIRSDNGPEFVAKAVREWIAAVGAKAAYIEPGSPCDLPLNFHPAAIRALANATPFGAVSVPA